MVSRITVKAKPKPLSVIAAAAAVMVALSAVGGCGCASKIHKKIPPSIFILIFVPAVFIFVLWNP
jgi:hypothetical protein